MSALASKLEEGESEREEVWEITPPPPLPQHRKDSGELKNTNAWGRHSGELKNTNGWGRDSGELKNTNGWGRDSGEFKNTNGWGGDSGEFKNTNGWGRDSGGLRASQPPARHAAATADTAFPPAPQPTLADAA